MINKSVHFSISGPTIDNLIDVLKESNHSHSTSKKLYVKINEENGEWTLSETKRKASSLHAIASKILQEYKNKKFHTLQLQELENEFNLLVNRCDTWQRRIIILIQKVIRRLFSQFFPNLCNQLQDLPLLVGTLRFFLSCQARCGYGLKPQILNYSSFKSPLILRDPFDELTRSSLSINKLSSAFDKVFSCYINGYNNTAKTKQINDYIKKRIQRLFFEVLNELTLRAENQKLDLEKVAQALQERLAIKVARNLQEKLIFTRESFRDLVGTFVKDGKKSKYPFYPKTKEAEKLIEDYNSGEWSHVYRDLSENEQRLLKAAQGLHLKDGELLVTTPQGEQKIKIRNGINIGNKKWPTKTKKKLSYVLIDHEKHNTLCLILEQIISHPSFQSNLTRYFQEVDHDSRPVS